MKSPGNGCFLFCYYCEQGCPQRRHIIVIQYDLICDSVDNRGKLA